MHLPNHGMALSFLHSFGSYLFLKFYKKSEVTKKQEYLLSKTGQTKSGVIIYIYNTYIHVSFSMTVFLYILQLKKYIKSSQKLRSNIN